MKQQHQKQLAWVLVEGALFVHEGTMGNETGIVQTEKKKGPLVQGKAGTSLTENHQMLKMETVGKGKKVASLGKMLGGGEAPKRRNFQRVQRKKPSPELKS